MVKILKVVIENCLMVYDRTEIRFKNGMCLVDGKNGSGKSSIRKFIEYGLIGKIDGSIENRFTKNKHRISIYLKDYANTYEIHHFLKYKKFKHKKDTYLNGFKQRPSDVIYIKNGTNLTMSNDKRSTIALFQSDIYFDENVFRYVNLMGCDLNYLPDLTDSEMKKKFDNIIDFFDTINEYKQRVVDLYSKQYEKYNIYYEKSIKNLTEQRMLHTNKVKKIDQVEKEKDKLKELIKENENKSNIYEVEIEEQKLKLEELNSQKDKISIDNIESDISDEEQKVSDEYDKKEQLLNELKFEYKQNERIKNSLTKDISNPVCPTCGQSISVEKQKEQLKSLDSTMKANLKNQTALVKSLKTLGNVLDSYEVERRDKLKELNKLLDEKVVLDNKINNLKSDILFKENKLKEFANVDERYLNALYKELDELNFDIKKVKEEGTSINKYKNGYDKVLIHLNWIKDVLYSNKGLKTDVLRSVSKKMTQIANKTYKKYFSNDINISIKTHKELKQKDKETGKPKLREKYHIEVINKKGADTFKGLSTGEKQMVNACCIEAFGWLCKNFGKQSLDFIYGDETFTGLKGANIEYMIDYLKAKKFATKLVTSHNDDVKEYFNNIIEVTKTVKGSTYNYK